MAISTVHDNGAFYTVTLASSTIQYVPKDPLNADYARVQAWLLGGGTLT